jgi:hypothetical protein
MESFGAMSNAVASNPVQSLVDSPPNKRRNTGVGVSPQTDISTDWDGNIATVVEARTMEGSLIANASTDTQPDNVCEGNVREGRG